LRDYPKYSKSKGCRAILLVILSLSLYGYVAPVKPVRASTAEQRTLYCTSVSYTTGGSSSSTHEDTHVSDNVYHWSYGRLFRWWDEEYGRGYFYVLEAEYSFNIGDIGGLDRLRVSQVEVNGEARINRASSNEIVDLYILNYRTNSWQLCGRFLGTTSDVTLSWSDTINPSDYIDTAGNMKLMWDFVAVDFSRLGIDFQCIKLTMRPWKWAFMVYLDADNDLDSFGVKDFNEMEMVGSTPDVAIIVQMDRYNASANRYLVTKDTDPNTITSPVVQALGEVNMGSNNTLMDFVKWVINKYVALHYCLVLWDHGNGFQYVCVDAASNYDYLDMIELKYALNAVKTDTGKIVDLIGFDACLMQMSEVAYQIRNYGTVMVASEETMPAEGWPYDLVLGNLTSTPDMDTGQFATKIVDAYEDYWTPTHYLWYLPDDYIPIVKLTLSAIDLTQMDNLAVYLDDFAIRLYNALLYDPNQAAAIRQCREKAQEYMTADSRDHWYYVDLYNFTKLVYDHPNISGTIKDRAYNLMEAINSTVIHEWHDYGAYAYYLEYHGRVREVWVWGCPGSHGLSIYFPDDQDDYFSSYEALDFSDEHFCWREFLKEYLGL